MSSHSVATGLKRTLPLTTMIFGEDSSDSYDVIITFHSAKNLPRTDLVGYSDPYFIAEIDHHISFTSTILSNTSAPTWDNEEWIIRNIPRNAELSVKLYDKDEEKLADDYIGQFVVHDLIDYNSPLEGHKIIGAFDQYSGSFYLSIQAIKSPEESKQLPKYTFDGPCRYFRHNSVAFGRLTMINADCVYSTWKISMRRIPVFFSPIYRQYWNREYKSAREIFGTCPLSLASRQAIKLAHKILYGRTLKHTESGRLNNATDLWKLVFLDKTTQRIKPCVYTYVINDTSWKFSETGVQFFTDFASKHALIANGSEYVLYAGEFHPRPKHGWDKVDDEWELVFDNESGTYSPNDDLLVNLKELLIFNFPGLNVVTYDYKDPRLKESKEELKIEMKKYKHIKPTIHQLVSHCRPLILN